MSTEDRKIITNNICTNLFRKTGRVFSKFSCSRDTPRNNYSGFLIAWVQFKISLPSRRFHKTFLSRPVGFVILLMRAVTIGLKRKFREGEKLAFICLHCDWPWEALRLLIETAKLNLQMKIPFNSARNRIPVDPLLIYIARKLCIQNFSKQ